MAKPPAKSATEEAAKKVAAATEEKQRAAYALHYPTISDQCFLLEKAGELQNKTVSDTSFARKPLETNTVVQKKVPVRQLGQVQAAKTFKSLRRFKSNLDYVNHITKLDKLRFSSYFQLTPDKISKLAHYISIEETLILKKNPKRIRRSPIMNIESGQKEFESADILKSVGKRTGAGIESVVVNYEGIDSATKKIVMVQAKFVFQDLREMFGDKYSKLFILQTSKKVGGRNFSRTIDFNIGWNGIEDLDLTLRTHLVKYTFDLRQDGSIIVDATYRGSFVETFSGPGSNFLSIAKNTFKQFKEDIEAIEKEAVAVAEKSVELEKEYRLKEITNKVFINEINKQINFRKSSGATGKIDSGEARVEIAGVKLAALKSLRDKLTAAKGEAGDALYTSSEIDSLLDDAKKQYESQISIALPATGPGAKGEYDSYQAFLEGFKGVTTSVTKKVTSSSKDAATFNAKNAVQLAFDKQLRRASLERFIALQQIAKQIVNSDDIKYILIDRDKIRDFKIASATGNSDEVRAVINSLPLGTVLKTKAEYVNLYGGDNVKNLDAETFQVVPFIFFGHFLENVLRLPTDVDKKSINVYELMKQAGDFRMDLGYTSYKAPFTGNEIDNLKLYYLPISLVEINNFFTRQVFSQGRDFYSFNDLVLDILRKFLSGVFGSCAKESNTQAFSPPKIIATTGNIPEGGKKDISQYFVYSAKDTVNDLKKAGITTRNFGNYNANIKGKIPHLFLFGADRGIEKNIKLADIADQNLKTAIYYSPKSSLVDDGAGGKVQTVGGFPPAVFQADIETIGFPLANIGQLIYIDLKPYLTAKQQALRAFKASGYYGVIKVSHTISKDNFSTNINAIIQVPTADKVILNKKKTGVKPTKTDSLSAKTREKIEAAAAKIEKSKEETEALEKTIEAEAKTIETGSKAIDKKKEEEEKAKDAAGSTVGGDSVVELDPKKPPEPKPEGVPLDDSESGEEDDATGGEGPDPEEEEDETGGEMGDEGGTG